MEKVKPLKIIFITLVAINDIEDRNLYSDLMRYFVKQGHHVTIVSPSERRYKIKTKLKKKNRYTILRIKTPNIQKTNLIEKGIGTFLVDYLLKSAIKTHLYNAEFDLAIYSTPPITLVNTIQYLKSTFNLKTYLLLKDIFPQNAADLGFMKKGSFIHRYFRNKEKRLYNLSDRIGCMSQANVNYIVKHNPHIEISKIEICPNSIEVQHIEENENQTILTKKKLGISINRKIFIYGGNLGKPQGIDFLIEVLESQLNNEKAFFIIIGSGTEYNKLESWYRLKKPENILLRSYLPKEEYDNIVRISDVGMIFLDYKFTIPNYPSRLLAYLENRKPVLAVTDLVTDVGRNAEKRGYGKWAPANDTAAVNNVIDFFCRATAFELSTLGRNGFEYLVKHYNVEVSYEEIMKTVF